MRRSQPVSCSPRDRLSCLALSNPSIGLTSSFLVLFLSLPAAGSGHQVKGYFEQIFVEISYDFADGEKGVPHRKTPVFDVWVKVALPE